MKDVKLNNRISNLELRLNPRVISASDGHFIASEMVRIGSTPRGVQKMLPKARAISLKLENLSRVECNILKQSLLSLGGDAAVHKFVLTEEVEPSNAVLVGTEEHFAELCKRLMEQPWSLPRIACIIKETLENYNNYVYKVPYAGGVLTLGKTTLIMGVLNVTPDSFSDGGKFADVDSAVARALKMASDGADIIDIGGQSTRPGSKPVSVKEELKRVMPVLEALSGEKLLISIDTARSVVAKEAIMAGAKIVNDITGLCGDKKLAEVVAKYKVPVIMMHIKGTPQTMQKNPQYDDLMSEIALRLRESIRTAETAGVARERLIIDPGIGFGKLPEHNIEILMRLRELKSIGCPILVGTSRKSFIGHYLGRDVGERLFGTVATVATAVMNWASIVRVHDVKEAADVVRMVDLVK